MIWFAAFVFGYALLQYFARRALLRRGRCGRFSMPRGRFAINSQIKEAKYVKHVSPWACRRGFLVLDFA